MRLSVVFLLVGAAAGKNVSITVLNEWPMIMAHDAATSYLQGGLLHQVNNWAKTQADGGAKGMLDCGARGFDWRPSVHDDGTVVMHHGEVIIHHEMGQALDEMVAWCEANPAPEDLVVLGITDIEGDRSKVTALLEARNISYVEDCSDLKDLTVEAAAKRSALPNGGSLLATFDCWVGHYEPAVTCSGWGDTMRRTGSDAPELLSNATKAALLDEALVYTCYADSSTKAFPLDRMWSYLANVSIAGPPSDGQLYTAQALWEESATTIAIGEAHGSTLLLDEAWSKLNAQLADRIRSGVWDVKRINFVEVNNVCDDGANLLAALRAIP